MIRFLVQHHAFSRRNRRLRTAGREGIAIGAVLLVIVLLGIIAMVVAAGTGDFGGASISDRVSAMIPDQAELIRNKINQCNTQYETAYSLCVSGQPCSVADTSDPYPLSNTTNGTDVASLLCDPMGSQGLWVSDNTLVPTPVTGFADWYYMDASGTGGGRCIWTQPTTNNPSGDAAIVRGLTKAANKFSNGTSYSTASEVIYDPASSSQKFVLWITLPTGTPDSNCLP